MINLLPPQEKERLIYGKNQKIILVWGFIIFAFLISLTLVILLVKIDIKGRVSSRDLLLRAAQQELEDPVMRDMQDNIGVANRLLVRIEPVVARGDSIGEIMALLVENLPASIRLTQLYYQANSRAITLSGFSPTRENLLLFRKNLENEKRFSKISFPPEVWFKPQDINFTASLLLQKI